MAGLNCTEAQSLAYLSGAYYCKDTPWKCASLYPQYGAAANWTVSAATHMCQLNSAPASTGGNASTVVNATGSVVCPAGYNAVCGVTCVCVSAQGGGTTTAGTNQTDTTGGVVTVISARQDKGGLTCDNAFTCFFVDALPYALAVTAGILLLLLLLACCAKRACCPRAPWCPDCCVRACRRVGCRVCCCKRSGKSRRRKGGKRARSPDQSRSSSDSSEGSRRSSDSSSSSDGSDSERSRGGRSGASKDVEPSRDDARRGRAQRRQPEQRRLPVLPTSPLPTAATGSRRASEAGFPRKSVERALTVPPRDAWKANPLRRVPQLALDAAEDVLQRAATASSSSSGSGASGQPADGSAGAASVRPLRVKRHNRGARSGSRKARRRDRDAGRRRSGSDRRSSSRDSRGEEEDRGTASSDSGSEAHRPRRHRSRSKPRRAGKR